MPEFFSWRRRLRVGHVRRFILSEVVKASSLSGGMRLKDVFFILATEFRSETTSSRRNEFASFEDGCMRQYALPSLASTPRTAIPRGPEETK